MVEEKVYCRQETSEAIDRVYSEPHLEPGHERRMGEGSQESRKQRGQKVKG